jgi:hypothetical protein
MMQEFRVSSIRPDDSLRQGTTALPAGSDYFSPTRLDIVGTGALGLVVGAVGILAGPATVVGALSLVVGFGFAKAAVVIGLIAANDQQLKDYEKAVEGTDSALSLAVTVGALGGGSTEKGARSAGVMASALYTALQPRTVLFKFGKWQEVAESTLDARDMESARATLESALREHMDKASGRDRAGEGLFMPMIFDTPPLSIWPDPGGGSGP